MPGGAGGASIGGIGGIPGRAGGASTGVSAGGMGGMGGIGGNPGGIGGFSSDNSIPPRKITMRQLCHCCIAHNHYGQRFNEKGLIFDQFYRDNE